MVVLFARRASIWCACALFLWFCVVPSTGAAQKPRSRKPRHADTDPVSVLVKLRPEFATQIEAAWLPGSASLGPAEPAAADFLTRHRGRTMAPLYPHIIQQKRQRGWSDRQATNAVRQRFPRRAARLREDFAPPEISRTYALSLAVRRSQLEAALNALRADPRVEFAEENKVVSLSLTTNDPYLSSAGSWGQPFDDLWGLKRIGAPEAWATTNGSGIVVAVVDSGLDLNHADIAANVWRNIGEVAGNLVDDDGNGYVDDVYGYNGVAWAQAPLDDHGHGTHVSGTIAAVGNNGAGVIGIAWGAKIMAGKAIDSYGNGYDGWLATAIIYAAQNGADVINNSWGAWGTSQTIAEAVDYAYSLGAVVVAAAGNSSDDALNYYPANHPKAITVAATSWGDYLASFSNRGSKIDVAAPGVEVLSLRAAGTSMGSPLNAGYTVANGTSMAAPHVAGVAALILDAHPEYSSEQVRQVLRVSAGDLGSAGFDMSFGYGHVDAFGALAISDALEARIMGPTPGFEVTSPITITGVAGGVGFSHYVLEFGYGQLPSYWTEFHTQASPAAGVLGVFDPALALNGDYTIRLTVYSTSGSAFVDRLRVVVRSAQISAPAPPTQPTSADTFKPGSVLSIHGTAVGAGFVDFQLEWARGRNALSGWSTAGVALAGGGTSAIADGLLGSWDTSGITVADYYTIRLRVNRGDSTLAATTTVYLEPDLVTVNWPNFLDRGPDYASGVLPARDSAGGLRLLAASSNSGFDPGALWTMSPAGALHKNVLPPPSYGSAHQPSVANLDGIPGDETVVANDTTVRVYRADHTSYELPAAPAVYFGNAQLVVEDLDGDGRWEIIAFGSDFNNDLGYIFAWRGDGMLLPNFPIPVADANNIRGYFNKTRLLVGDVDGDGQREIMITEGVSANSFVLRLFRANGTAMSWGAPEITGLPQAFAAADLDHNGKLNLILGVSNGSTYSVHVLRPDGTARPGWPVTLLSSGQYRRMHIAVGDLDRNGSEEIVFSHQDDLYVFKQDGTAFSPAWPRRGYGASFGAPVIGNVDGGTEPEIVLTRMAVLPGPYDEQKLLALRSDGTVARTWELTGRHDNALYVNGLPAIGDFDDDGLTEIAVAYILWGGSGPGVVTLLNTGTPHQPASDDWPVVSRDIRNSAVLVRAGGALELSSAALEFEGAVGTSSTQTVTISNFGPSAVVIENITLTPVHGTRSAAGLSHASTCGVRLAAGAQCAIEVTFAPQSRAPVRAVLQVFGEASGAPLRATIEAYTSTPRKRRPTVSVGATAEGEALPPQPRARH